MADFSALMIPSKPDLLPSDSASALMLTFGGGGAPPVVVNYIQRVFSTGLSAWCMYTQTSLNPTPAPGDTTPNWTGAISAWEFLARY